MDNIRFINDLDKLLQQKESDYGSFDTTYWLLTGILERLLSAHNGVQIKVPIKIFGIFMIVVKLWRIMNQKNYHKDSFDDIAGYNELLRKMLKNEEKYNKK